MDFTKTGVVIRTDAEMEFKGLQKWFAEISVPRTIANWNEIRETCKAQYNQKIIGMLDASGYITKWLKGE